MCTLYYNDENRHSVNIYTQIYMYRYRAFVMKISLLPIEKKNKKLLQTLLFIRSSLYNIIRCLSFKHDYNIFAECRRGVMEQVSEGDRYGNRKRKYLCKSFFFLFVLSIYYIFNK